MSVPFHPLEHTFHPSELTFHPMEPSTYRGMTDARHGGAGNRLSHAANKKLQILQNTAEQRQKICIFVIAICPYWL
ncbi:MAG TPA: hypothetical protein DCG33_03835 [Prevotellaceae bacterium]|nr:hypothetical protein [Prevotellaceae bacterium]